MKSQSKNLSKRELIRYSRHFHLDEVGVGGQKRLKASSALLVGAGGLGSPLALYLAAAGVGRLGLVDFDVVDETNLQRQILHGTDFLGLSKLESASRRLADLNPHIDLELHDLRLSSQNALQLFERYEVVADGADNFPTRYLVNDACVLTGKPLVSGSIQGFEGQLSVYNYRGGPCYRCLFPEPPPAGSVPSCAEGGVLGVLPGVIGCLQANEVLKILLEIGEPARGRVILFDALELKFNSLNLGKDPNCVVCGEHPSITELIDYASFCGLSQEDSGADNVPEITPKQLASRREAFLVIDVRDTYEREICRIEPSLHVPLHEIRNRELPRDTQLVIYCKTGIRSRRAVNQLRARNYEQVFNLTGGVLAWIDEIDPNQEKY